MFPQNEKKSERTLWVGGSLVGETLRTITLEPSSPDDEDGAAFCCAGAGAGVGARVGCDGEADVGGAEGCEDS